MKISTNIKDQLFPVQCGKGMNSIQYNIYNKKMVSGLCVIMVIKYFM
jgi:hypothetical protein